MARLVARFIAYTRGPEGRKLLRYSAVSVVAVVITNLVIFLTAWLLDASGVVANTLGTAVATIPSYELNRRWVWGKNGKSHLWKEVVPFWSLTFAGWLASTAAVRYADHLARQHHLSSMDKGFAFSFASLSAYGVIWIVKFVLLNKVMFVHRAPADLATSIPDREPAWLPLSGIDEGATPAVEGAAELRG